jgi:hypothetical protein
MAEGRGEAEGGRGQAQQLPLSPVVQVAAGE